MLGSYTETLPACDAANHEIDHFWFPTISTRLKSYYTSHTDRYILTGGQITQPIRSPWVILLPPLYVHRTSSPSRVLRSLANKSICLALLGDVIEYSMTALRTLLKIYNVSDLYKKSSKSSQCSWPRESSLRFLIRHQSGAKSGSWAFH